MRPLSITFRLALFFSTASTAVLLALGYWIGAAVERHFEEQDLHEFEGKLVLIRHALSKAHTTGDLDQVARRLEDALIGHHGLLVSVFWPGQRTLFASPESAQLEPFLQSQPAAGSTRPVTWSQDGQSYRGMIAAAATDIPGSAPATVALALNIDHHLEFLATFRKSLWLALAAGILLTALLGWIAARRGLAPLRDMASVAHGISASRLESRLSLATLPEELRELASAFNQMLARLEDSFRRLSDFSSDLAHELRTPINNLMILTQVALSKARSADEYSEVLYSNLEEYEQLARMISDMLFLAKADNGLIVPRAETIDLAAEVRQLIEYYEAWSEDQGVTLDLDGAGAVQGDRLMLRRAIGNLLSNAIHHTPRGETVRFRIEQAPSGSIRLAIENPGETIPPEHQSRLFDRFYRADPSRHRSHEGAGLGLAITKSIIEAHGGRIGVSSDAGLTRFELTFPAG